MRDNWALFQLLDLDSGFLEHPATKWKTLENYRKGKHIVFNLPVLNNAVERAPGIAADANIKTAPESANELQDLYKVICGARKQLRTKATSDETVTRECKL